MTETPNVRIPTRHEHVFQALATMPDDAFSQLLDSLSAVDEGSTAGQFRAALDSGGSLPGEVTSRQLVDAITGINVLRSSHNWELAPTVDGLVVAAERELHVSAEPLRTRASLLLGLSSLWHTSKAYDVATAYSRSLHTVRVLTDIRPVFDELATERPRTAVIVHSLELNTYDDTGRTRMIHVALDRADLESLKLAAERGLDKADTLESLLRETNIAVHSLEKD